MTLPPPPSARTVSRFYGFLTVLLSAIAVPILAMLPLQLAGRPLPLWPTDELTAYLAATGGAGLLGAALLAAGVVRRPERSAVAAAPLTVLFFGFAMVRYLTYFFGTEAVGRFGPALLVEVVVFMALGVFASLVRTDAPTSLRGVVRSFGGVLPHLPGRLKPRLALLVAAVVVGPFFFLSHRPAQMLAMAQILNLAGFALAGWHRVQRITGVSHLFAWTPAVAVVATEALAGGATGAYAVWLPVAAVTGVLCLIIDAVDFVRWLAGDRSELAPMAW